MLHVPTALQRSEQCCPARADPRRKLKSAVSTTAVAGSMQDAYTFEERCSDDDVLIEDADSFSVLP